MTAVSELLDDQDAETIRMAVLVYAYLSIPI